MFLHLLTALFLLGLSNAPFLHSESSLPDTLNAYFKRSRSMYMGALCNLRIFLIFFLKFIPPN